ncbi:MULTISPECIES: heparan-alpha-glucosaminide N-acetyltransferase domain-containing protein [unclassified Blastococcus]
MDLARGVAVLGMFGAHMGIGDDAELDLDPSTWPAVVDGRSSILFAVLAGVSIALLSGGPAPAEGEELVRARVRILVRAAWVFLIGGLLELLDTFVAVILGVYAILFVLAVPFLRWRPARLLALAGVLAVVTPVVDLLVGQLVTENGNEDEAFAQTVVTGVYPAVIWWTFVLVGLAVGRLDLRASRTRLALLGTGTALAVLGYAGGWWSTGAWADGRASEGIEEGFRHAGEVDPAWLSGAAPHGGTTFEVVGSTGVALAVLGLCLVLADLLPRLTHPLASVGALALTVYSAHLVAIAVLDPGYPAGTGLWLRFCVVALVAAPLWRLLLGAGPLERLLTRTSRAAAGAPGAAGSRAAGP